MKIVFWDIDGTLIRTAKAGLYALNRATEELYGRGVDFAAVPTGGMTDTSIAARIVEIVEGRAPDLAEIKRLTGLYETFLEDELRRREGSVLPGVEAALAAIAAAGDCASLLLTGNSRAGAAIKMRRFGLAGYFDFDHSGFCEDSYDRNDIAARACRLARRAYPGVAPDDLYVVGDTPNDIRCGKSIAARTIAVATGPYALAELAGREPWWSVERIPPPPVFLAKIRS